MEKLYEERWYQKREKEAFLGKTTNWYRYQNRVVPVPPYRTQPVPVPRQVIPVPPCRTGLVPVPNRVVRYHRVQNAQIVVISYN